MASLRNEVKSDVNMSVNELQSMESACEMARETVLARQKDRAHAQLLGNVGTLPEREDGQSSSSNEPILSIHNSSNAALTLGAPVLVPRGPHNHLYTGLATRIFLTGEDGIAVTVLFISDYSAWTIHMSQIQPFDARKKCVLDTWTIQRVSDFVAEAIKFRGVAIQQETLMEFYHHAMATSSESAPMAEE